MHHKKGNTILIILIIILAIIAIAAIGTTIYFWQKSKRQTTQVTTTMPTVSPTITKTLTPTATPTEQTQETPQAVTEKFMLATLGTLPKNGQVNYDLARTYMTESLKAQNTGESWVPLFYGIQDGPESVKFISQNISADSATVRFDPSWGEMSLGWSFILVKENGSWLIDEFRNDAQ